MEELNPGIVGHLRVMAREGRPASGMLREVIASAVPTTLHKITLVKYLKEAFGLSLQQASPVAGWAPDGTGELSDAQLDELLMPEILNSRATWESLDRKSSA